MTCYILQAVDPETGEGTEMTVKALSPANATAKARKLGMVVTGINHIVNEADDAPGRGKALALSDMPSTSWRGRAA